MFTNPYLTVTSEVDVIGLGQSVKHYDKNSKNMSIGVNDSWKIVKSELMVIIDPPELWQSSEDKPRLPFIIMARPKFFFTNREGWKGKIHNYTPIQLYPFRADILSINYPDHVSNSFNSAFVAAVLAYKLGAKKINLWGVDFVGHKNLGTPYLMKECIQDFIVLRKLLAERGVVLNFPPSPSALHGL